MLEVSWSTVAAQLFVVGIGFLAWRTFFRRKNYVPEKAAVFVTGCDTGIGRRLAIHLDSLGCEVFAGCLRPAREEETVPNTSEPSFPPSVHIIPLDVTNEESVIAAKERVHSELRQKGKELWCLVNNAGVCTFGEFGWQTWAQIEEQVQVNLLGTFRVTKHFLPLIRTVKGRIIIVGSLNGIVAYPSLTVYSATKFALEGFSDSLRREENQQGVHVILVRPGDVAKHTAIMASHKERAYAMWAALPEEVRASSEGQRFRQYNAAALRYTGLTGCARFEDSPVLGALQDAVLGQQPDISYTAANYSLYIFINILQILPKAIVDKILAFTMTYISKSVPAEEFPIEETLPATKTS